MKITRFQKIKQHRIFRDFAWPGAGLPDFARFNLIYGWNGAGKTTLSNLFRHLQRREAVVEGEVGVALNDGRTVPGTEFPTAALPNIRVFNRDTVDRSIFEVPGKELPPVYYLGEDSAKTQEEIESLKKQHGEAVVEAGRQQAKHGKLKKALDQYEADQAKAIKNLLTAPGSDYNNYNAANFRGIAERLLKTPGEQLSDSSRQQFELAIRGSALPKIERPTDRYPDLVALSQRVDALLKRSIFSSVIEDLRDKPNVSAWVASGLALHRGEHASESCLFCTQQIPLGRLEQLEGHFNDAYTRFQGEIADMIVEVDSAQALVMQPALPVAELLYPELRDRYANEVQRCAQHASLSANYLTTAKRALVAKQKEPFKQFDFHSFFSNMDAPEEPSTGFIKFVEVLLSAASGVGSMFAKRGFDTACALINQHNQRTENFETELRKARSALAQDCVLEVIEEYHKKRIELDAVQEKQKAANAQRAELESRITDLERSIRHHHPAADELSKDMAAYLGRDELRFEARDAGYVITRNGRPAMNLSEGERTAIAFMYFLKSLQDTNFDLKSGIVVIDDPVSSLDANSLYCAFGFMKARIQDAHQVFVLTHNFTFFRQVKNWFDHVAKIRDRSKANLLSLKDVRYYMLRSRPAERGRSATLAVLDDLLYEHESEYHHMFKLVLEASGAAADAPMSQFYALPNIARRLLEAVLAFKQPGKTGELYQQIKDIPFDEAKKARILRFTNTYSHHGLMPEPLHDLSVMAETPEVLRDVLALVKHLDAEHFDSMLKLCSPDQEEVAA